MSLHRSGDRVWPPGRSNSVAPEVPEWAVHYGARDVVDPAQALLGLVGERDVLGGDLLRCLNGLCGLVTSSRISSRPTSSNRVPNLSSHDLSTTARSDAVRWLAAPAQPIPGKMSAGRAAGTSPIRASRVYWNVGRSWRE